MKALIRAISDKFVEATSLQATITGGLWLNMIQDPEIPEPYVTYHLIGGPPPQDGFSGNHRIEFPTIQFSIFDNDISAVRVSTLNENLNTLYDGVELAIAGYHSIIMKKEGSHLMKEDDFWNFTADFQIITQDIA